MDYKETEQKNIRGISITKKGERAFHCALSLDTHMGSKEGKVEAIGLMYIKALLSGCNGYTREEFLDAINLLGATINVGIDRGMVTVTLISIDTHKDKILKLAEAMLTSPSFAPKELKRIAGLLENELHEEKEDAKTQSLYALINSLYKEEDRRYVSKTDEVIKLVSSVTKKDLQKFHTLATTSQWIFTLTCDSELEVKTVKKLVAMRTAFADAVERATKQHVENIQKLKVELISIPSKQNIELNFGGLLPLYITDKEYYAFLFGLNVLGKWGGFAGRLMSTVREKEGLTYGIYARTETAGLTEFGYWRIMTFFAPDKALAGINSTLREIYNIRDNGITKIEYERFKTILKTGHTLLNDSIIRTAGDIHNNQIKGLHFKDIEEHRKNMLNVTVSDVNEALKKYLNPDLMVIAGAGPVQSKLKELKALERLAKNEK